MTSSHGDVVLVEGEGEGDGEEMETASLKLRFKLILSRDDISSLSTSL